MAPGAKVLAGRVALPMGRVGQHRRFHAFGGRGTAGPSGLGAEGVGRVKHPAPGDGQAGADRPEGDAKLGRPKAGPGVRLVGGMGFKRDAGAASAGLEEVGVAGQRQVAEVQWPELDTGLAATAAGQGAGAGRLRRTRVAGAGPPARLTVMIWWRSGMPCLVQGVEGGTSGTGGVAAFGEADRRDLEAGKGGAGEARREVVGQPGRAREAAAEDDDLRV